MWSSWPQNKPRFNSFAVCFSLYTFLFFQMPFFAKDRPDFTIVELKPSSCSDSLALCPYWIFSGSCLAAFVSVASSTSALLAQRRNSFLTVSRYTVEWFT